MGARALPVTVIRPSPVATGLLVSGRRAGLERHLVRAARLDELLSRAAAVGVGVGHGAAQLPDGWCLPCGLFGSLAFCAVWCLSLRRSLL
jgi:hypothetical protein